MSSHFYKRCLGVWQFVRNIKEEWQKASQSLSWILTASRQSTMSAFRIRSESEKKTCFLVLKNISCKSENSWFQQLDFTNSINVHHLPMNSTSVEFVRTRWVANFDTTSCADFFFLFLWLWPFDSIYSATPQAQVECFGCSIKRNRASLCVLSYVMYQLKTKWIANYMDIGVISWCFESCLIFDNAD